MVQLDTSARKDMIMCPGTDTKNFSVSEEGESLWLRLGKASIKEVRLYCGLKDRYHIPSQSVRERIHAV